MDTVTIEVAKANGWVADFTEYQVMITAEDIDIYRQYNKDFVKHFEFFDFNFEVALSLCGKHGIQNKFKLKIGITFKNR